jgi:hypothetical protein
VGVGGEFRPISKRLVHSSAFESSHVQNCLRCKICSNIHFERIILEKLGVGALFMRDDITSFRTSFHKQYTFFRD